MSYESSTRVPQGFDCQLLPPPKSTWCFFRPVPESREKTKEADEGSSYAQLYGTALQSEPTAYPNPSALLLHGPCKFTSFHNHTIIQRKY